MSNTLMNPHLEYQAICELVETGSRVLDLGCGDGDLLKMLRDEKKVVHGIGVEKSDDKIFECIQKGISVHHGNLDVGLADYPDDSFDYVILSETLQEVHKPSLVIQEMLRVGRWAIVTFPNFGNWRIRFQILLTGSTPMTQNLPYQWYETPNVQYLSVSDFLHFCKEKNYTIEQKLFFSFGRKFTLWPNLLAESALFVVTTKS